MALCANALPCVVSNASRVLATLHSSVRRTVANLNVAANNQVKPSASVAGYCELDSHADTCVLGSNFVPLYFTERVFDVSPYDSQNYQPSKEVPIVAGSMTFQSQSTGQTFILVINEALWMGDKLSHLLINPNQF